MQIEEKRIKDILQVMDNSRSRW